MNSIQRRLVLVLVASLAGVLLVGNLGVYFFTRGMLLRDFDTLLGTALPPILRNITMQLAEEQGKESTFNLRNEPVLYLQVWTLEGKSMGRSSSLGEGRLPFLAPGGETVTRNLTLPNGRRGRGPTFLLSTEQRRPPTEARFRAERERVAPREVARRGEVAEGQGRPLLPASLVLTVLADRTDLDVTLRRLSASLVVMGGVMLAAVAGVVSLVSRRGLAPLERVAELASTVDARRLDFRFPTERMPLELRKICNRLNDLLSRLQSAFERERCFTSDVAHELRTPIAELRALAEVALRWPVADAQIQNGFRDALDIALQMQAIVNGLLAIARCEAGMQPVSRETVDLAELVRETWKLSETIASQRELAVRLEVERCGFVITDRAMVTLILRNLISNSVEYTPRGGAVHIAVTQSREEAHVLVENATDNLTAEDLPRMFERFWRKDLARSSSEHSGIGLSVARAFAQALRLSLQAKVAPGGVLTMRLGPFKLLMENAMEEAPRGSPLEPTLAVNSSP